MQLSSETSGSEGKDLGSHPLRAGRLSGGLGATAAVLNDGKVVIGVVDGVDEVGARGQHLISGEEGESGERWLGVACGRVACK